MKKTLQNLAGKIVLCVLLIIVGAAAVVAAFLVATINANAVVKYVIIGIGGALASGCLIALAVTASKYTKFKKQYLSEQAGALDVNVGSVEEADFRNAGNGAQKDDGSPVVNYIPSENVVEFVNMGQKQSVEEKFDQISKMDHTQFVIYIAKLFSHKGYQVKLTPVADNRDVDMLVEKMGAAIAVGCVNSKKILSEKDVRPTALGRQYYGTVNGMVVTNMFYDKTAVEYATREGMSLVDRAILIDDFM